MRPPTLREMVRLLETLPTPALDAVERATGPWLARYLPAAATDPTLAAAGLELQAVVAIELLDAHERGRTLGEPSWTGRPIVNLCADAGDIRPGARPGTTTARIDATAEADDDA